MMSAIVFSIFMGSLSQAQRACVPNYQFIHSECKSTGVIKSWETKTISHQLANRGACDREKATDECNNYDKTRLLKIFPEGKVESVHVRDVKLEPTLELCGPIHDLRRKVDIYCTFEMDVPQVQKVAHESCPTIDVVESSKCYDQSEVVVDKETLTSCLSIKPVQLNEWWKKAACLSDLSRAAHMFNVTGLTQESASEIERQVNLMLRIAAKRSDLEPVANYMGVQQRRIGNLQK